MRIGSDPEVFLIDTTGKHISSIGLINADKWHPLQIPDMPEGFTLQEDNVTVEYGIPPAASKEEFIGSINAVIAKSLEWFPHLKFSKLSATVFEPDQMVHPRAWIFGCEPDFNAWTEKENQAVASPEPMLRSAGGHVHIETAQDPYTVVRRADLYLGVPSILMDNGEKRKQLYGKAGACRIKPYGVEYRTLSNFWVFDDKLIGWVWDNTAKALESKVDVSACADAILEAINNNNKKVAQELVDAYSLEVI